MRVRSLAAYVAGVFAVSAVPAACAIAPEQSPASTATVETQSAALTADGQVEAWVDRSVPQGRLGHMSAYDEARQELVIFGGQGISGFASGTWTWNGTWKRRAPTVSPTPRLSGSMTYDRDRKRVILFGGISSAITGETWSWDGTNWSLLSPANRPAARYSAAMAYDEVRQRVVLWGGFGGSGALSDTWTFDGTTWKQEFPPTSPVNDYRVGHMAFDRVHGTTQMAFQGAGSSCPIEVWRWDGKTWAQSPATGAIPHTCTFNASYDSKQNALVVVGGTLQGTRWVQSTWSFDGTTWTDTTEANAPVALNNFSLDYDTSRNELLMFGGSQASGASRYVADLSRRSGTTWSVDPSGSPAGRAFAGLSAAQNESVLLFGGNLPNILADTWLFDGKGWRELKPATAPDARWGANLAFDEKRNQVVLYGGRNNAVLYYDTWTWDGSVWQKRSPAHVPNVFEARLVYDTVRERTYLFDGWTDPVAVWSWDGNDWMQITPTTPLPRRRDISAAFDRARGKTVIFGGATDLGLTDDTYTWDGIAWTLLTPVDRPASRSGASLAWDAIRKQVVLFGGLSQNNVPLNDIWSWDGTNWSSLVNPKATVIPLGRYYASLQPIGSTGNLLLFNGQTPDGYIEDQWTFRTRGGKCTSGAQCGSGSCVDGVCCESSTCGSCETCAGLDPGVCESIRNAEDPDSCRTVNGQRCNADGKCLGSAGAPCKAAADCSTSACVDGFCCNTTCSLPCEACAAATKQSGTDDGRCGPAKSGSNPGGRCAAKDVCNASGACEKRTEATCVNESVLDLGDGSTQDCAPYTCRAGACSKTCASYKDCTFPASCSTDGRCEVRANSVEADGCSFRAAGTSDRWTYSLGALGLLLCLRKRRARP